MSGFLMGFGAELIKLAADPRLAQLAPPSQPAGVPAQQKPVAPAPAPYQTPQTGKAGTPAPAPSNQIGASSAYLNAMRPQAMQSPSGGGRPDTYRPVQAFEQKAPPAAAPQPAQATPGGQRAGGAAPSGRFAYETGQNFLARRAGETLSNVMSPMSRGSGAAAKPTGYTPPVAKPAPRPGFETAMPLSRAQVY